MSRMSVANLFTTRRPLGDYDGATILSTTDVTKSAGISASESTMIGLAAEMVASTLVMSVCIAATIFGNVLVVMSVFTYRPLRGVQNFYIVSLAVADLAVAVLVMPLNVANFVMDGRWAFGAVVCHIWLTADILTCTASILNLCAIALDRYRAIHDPIGYAQRRTISRVLTSVAVVWITSVVISVPPLIGWNAAGLYDESTQRCQLTDDRGFVLYSAAGSFYIPLALMTFVYIKIYLATRRRLRARAENYRITAVASSASGAGKARTTPEQGDDRVQPTSTHREGHRGPELLEIPSIESLTNDDIEQRTPEVSATSAAVAYRFQPETVIDKTFTLSPPSTTDVATTTNQQSLNVLMTSIKDRLPEDKQQSENTHNDVTQAQFNVYSDLASESSADRQEVTPHMKSNYTGIMIVSDVCNRPTHSAEVKDDSSTELKIKSSCVKSTKKRRWSDENCATTRRLLKPGLPRQLKWTSMATIGRFQLTPENGSRSEEQSIAGRSEVVSRVKAVKQRQATLKERRVARTMAVIMAAFVVCWLPFFIVYILFPFCGAVCSEAVGERVVTFIVWLGYINSTINPIIYTIFNVDFRRAFKLLLFSGYCCRGRLIR